MSRAARFNSRRGVTVVEAALVVTLLGGVALGAALLVVPRMQADDADMALRDAQRIQRAASDWQKAHGGGCPTLTQLQRDRELARESRTDDPWGERYRVICGDDDITVSSPGRDGKPNTDDDIRVSRSTS
jgi:general secretion pathway protein G